jgi:hypothetical protein
MSRAGVVKAAGEGTVAVDPAKEVFMCRCRVAVRRAARAAVIAGLIAASVPLAVPFLIFWAKAQGGGNLAYDR